MNYGIKTPPQHCTWQQMLDVWRATDEVELFTSCWNFDHFYPLVGDQHGPCMEAWVTLTALAAATRRVRVGCMVQGTPYRHPALTANMAATLDIVSDGRLNLGLGAGWHEGECAAYGFDLLPMKQRMDRFAEAVAVIRSLLAEKVTEFHGTYFQLNDARCEPKGIQPGGPPIVIGGGGERRTLRIVAEHADHWNLPFATPEVFKAKKAVLAEHCASAGRDLEEIECSVQIALPADEDPGLSAANARALQEAGVDTVLFTLRPPYRATIIEPLARALERTG
jgi:F420-dependent oxidoreductase-like protein